MKIPEFPQLTSRQTEMIMACIFFIFIFFLFPISLIFGHISDHQFYVSHKQECLSQNGNWKEETDRNGRFSWSCNYKG